MKAADDLQGPVVHGLRVDADARDAVILQHPQLLPGDGVGTPRLYGEFMAGNPVGVVQPGNDPVQVRRRQNGGRAAAEVKGAYKKPVFLQQLGAMSDVLYQMIRVFAQDAFLLGHLGPKGAVKTAAAAEGDVQIHGGAFGRHGLYIWPLDGGDLLHQRLLLKRYGEQLPEGSLCFRLPLTPGDLPKELGGPDAREGPPGRGHRTELLHDLIDAQLQRPLLMPFHVQGIRPRLHGHDLLHVLRHGQAFGLSPVQDDEQPQLRRRRIGQDVRLSKKQTDFLCHVVEKAFGVCDQLNHG